MPDPQTTAPAPQTATAGTPLASGTFECINVGLTTGAPTPTVTPSPTAPTDCNVQFVSVEPTAKLRGSVTYVTDMATANTFDVGKTYTLSIS